MDGRLRLGESAVNDLESLALIFNVDLEFMEKLIKFLNLSNTTTTEDLIHNLIFTWPPTLVFQDF